MSLSSSSSSSRTRGRRRQPSPGDRHDRHLDPLDRPSQRPTGRRRKLALLAVVVLAVVVWLLPMIVAHSPLLAWIVGQATGDLNGTASLRSASLGWFSPVRASGVEVRDNDGQVVVDVPELSSGKSLVNLATNWKQLGSFTLERPTVNVVLGPDGSNIEELVAKYLTGPSGEPVAVELKIIDATIHIQDRLGGAPWSIEKFNLTLAVSDKPDGPMTLIASGLVPDGVSPGKFDVAVQTGADGRIQLETKGLETAKLSALLARFAPGVRLAGRLNAAVTCNWNAQSPMRVAADLACTDFHLACPQLGTDQIQLAALKAAGRIALDQNNLQIDNVAVETDLGGFAATGQIDLSGSDPAATLQALLGESFELRGQIDLARAAAMLPGTLHINPQTTVTSGRLTVDLANRPGEQGMVCHGTAELSPLAAVYQGKPLTWQQPVTVGLDVRQAGGDWIVDRLDCSAPFLTLQAAGSRGNLSGRAQFDLDQLARQLAGFVDLGGLQLAGKGSAEFAWARNAQQAFLANGSLTARDFRLTMPGRPPWQESSVSIKLRAAGTTDFGPATTVDSAELTLEAGAESLTARLAKPVANLSAEGPWPVALNTQGNLAHWTARAKAWNLLTDYSAAGTYRMTANVVASPSHVELADAQLMVDGLRLAGAGFDVNEPRAQLALAGSYDRATGRIIAPNATLQCNTITLTANDVAVSMPDAGPMEMAGNVAYRGDLARLQAWITTPGAVPTWRAYGQLQGTGQVKHTAGKIDGQIDATVGQLVLQGADGRQFRDPQTRLVARGAYNSSSGQLKLDEILLATAAAHIGAAGQADSLGTDTKLQLTGQIGYDWQKLMPLLQPYVGNQVVIAGQGARPFSASGPLDPAGVQAAASLDWSGAYAYGFQVGPGELDARVANGVVQIAPLDLAVSEGRFTAQPRLRLSPEPALLELEPGPLVQQVRINPQMCDQGLQYIAPILAGVATAEGRFSIALDECQIRLDDPARSRLAGRLTVHTVEVGPGALVRELAVVLNRAGAARLQRESTIRFHLADGRVHHEGLELVFPEMTIRTHGWVGLDQSLSLVAEMPIPPKWLAGHQMLDAAFKNQILKVPIRGTLDRPQIDHRKLDEYNRSLIRKATRSAIEGGLNRLFGPQ